MKTLPVSGCLLVGKMVYFRGCFRMEKFARLSILPIREEEVKTKHCSQTYTFCEQLIGSETQHGLLAKSYGTLVITYKRGFKEFGG